MKFVRGINDVGKTIIKIDLEGLSLPVENAETYLEFVSDTYVNLKASKANIDETWDYVFKVPNEFLKTLKDDELIQIASTFAYCHYLIESETAKQRPLPDNNPVLRQEINSINAAILLKLEDNLSAALLRLDQTIHLLDKILEHVETCIPIDEFKDVGTRAQDSEEKTFRRPDLVKLTALAVLAKLFTPVIGTFIQKFKLHGISTSYKEMHAVTMFRDILSESNNEKMAKLVDKVEFYISGLIESRLKDAKPTMLHNGFTETTITQFVYAQIITRRLVCVNLFRAESNNLVTYLATCAKESALSTPSSSAGGNKSSVEFRKSVDELSAESSEGGDDGNSSVLEQESSVSAKTADFETIVEFAVMDLKHRFCPENDLDITVVDGAESYYKSTSHILLESNNSYILSIMFGHQLCGAKSVEMLKSADLATLVAILQVHLIRIGLTDLVHVLSLVNTGEPRTKGLTGEETQLQATWRNSYAFGNCNEKFPYVVNGLQWWTSLEKLLKSIIMTKYVYNTAPIIWEMLGQPNINGQMYTAPVTLSESICNFIWQRVH